MEMAVAMSLSNLASDTLSLNIPFSSLNAYAMGYKRLTVESGRLRENLSTEENQQIWSLLANQCKKVENPLDKPQPSLYKRGYKSKIAQNA
jgi:hypothetical protein